MQAQRENRDLVVLRQVKKHYPVTKGLLHRQVGKIRAVDGIDLTIRRGETLGLVGESGCGKSTLGRIILRLEEATEGEILFDGRNIARLSPREMHEYRKRMQIIFQDPYASLDPRQSIGRIIGEGLVIHRVGSPAERRKRVEYLMEVVGLRPEQYGQYPHEFSGGQRQRIGIARALALNPEFVICDEPLSALDVSIQAQVINLLQDLQEEYHLTYLFISHDLSVVRHISDRVAVMYLGSLVEWAETEALFEKPYHPYTRALLQAIPTPDPEKARSKPRFSTESPAQDDREEPCRFQPHCPDASESCGKEAAPLKEIAPNHWARCHR